MGIDLSQPVTWGDLLWLWVISVLIAPFVSGFLKGLVKHWKLSRRRRY
jgi:hypothetical protein